MNIAIRLIGLLLCVLLGAAAALPDQIPVPEPRPEVQKPADEAKPVAAQDKKAEPEKTEPSAETGPVEKPADTYVPPPIIKEDPAELAECISQLEKLGATFTAAKPIDDGNGCGIESPIEITGLGMDVAIRPAATLRCETALQLARWTQGDVIPMLKMTRPGETLSVVNQASGYICRKRNSAETGKISEHAHGNAVDIAGFTLKSGKSFDVKPREEDGSMEGAFQRAIVATACLYFATVLDPGSDSAHETHLHLDVLKRKNGYRYCW